MPATTGRPTLPADLADLVGRLADPDPEVRDEGALGELSDRVGAGDADEHLDALADAAVALLGHPEVQARTFGVLAVGLAVDRDRTARTLSPAAFAEALAAVEGWYADEQDLRGWDDTLGWLHALAHGADTVADLGESRHASPEQVQGLLELLARRVVTPSSYRLEQGEDDRIAYAATRLMALDPIEEADVDVLVGTLATAWREGEPGPVAPWQHAAVQVSRALLVHLLLGVSALDDEGRPAAALTVRHAGYAVRQLEQAIAEMYPWLGGGSAGGPSAQEE